MKHVALPLNWRHPFSSTHYALFIPIFCMSANYAFYNIINQALMTFLHSYSEHLETKFTMRLYILFIEDVIIPQAYNSVLRSLQR